MSTEMLTTTNVIDMPVEQVTEAIVAAAKRVRKPKAEITIVEQIVSDILAGKFAEEAAAHLKQIFGDEFCIKRGLMEKPKKTRKPKAPKEVPVTDAESKEATSAEPKEKKARKPKAPKEVPVTDAEPKEVTNTEPKEVTNTEPKEKKARKPKAPKEATVEAPAEAPVEEKPKVKKVRKTKEVTVTVEAPVTVEEPVVVEEKPKVKKVTKKPVSPKETEPKEKKVTKKPTSPKETPVVEPVSTPVLETDEFSENWGKPLEDELVEEELSDIEEEE